MFQVVVPVQTATHILSLAARAGFLAAFAVVAQGRVAAAGPGDHIRVGNIEMSPGVEVGGEYRANVYLAEDNEVSGFNLNASPFVGAKLTNENLILGLDAAYHLKKYLKADLSNLDRFNNTDLGLDANILPKARVGALVSDSFVIASRPSEAESAEDANITKIANDAKLLGVVRPGTALEISGGLKHVYQDYRTPAEASYDNDSHYNTKSSMGPVLNGRWRFFPRTAVVAQASAEWFDWEYNVVDIAGVDQGVADPDDLLGQYLAVPDGSTWRFKTGLTGRITERTALNLLFGYGQATFDTQSVIDAGNAAGASPEELQPTATGFDKNVSGGTGVLVTLGVKYALMHDSAEPAADNHILGLGYEKDFVDTYFTNYVAFHSLYGRYDGKFMEKLGTTLVVSYRHDDYEGEVTRQDHFLRLRTDLSYDITRFAKVETGVRWDRRISADGMHAEAEYSDLVAHGDLTFTY